MTQSQIGTQVRFGTREGLKPRLSGIIDPAIKKWTSELTDRARRANVKCQRFAKLDSTVPGRTYSSAPHRWNHDANAPGFHAMPCFYPRLRLRPCEP